MHPTKPNSSPKALNIKSVCCSGINCKLVSLPSSKPVPNNHPEPIAILLCIKWYPPPNGSLFGSKNKTNLSFWYSFKPYCHNIGVNFATNKCREIARAEKIIFFFEDL